MCGRYTITKSGKELIERFSIEKADIAFHPRYNIAPKQSLPVIRRAGSQNILSMMQWGLIPSWSKDPSIGQKMINARAETLRLKPSFKKPFHSQRCLVPADSFYEWQTNKDKQIKTPVRFMLKSTSIFAFAGLWERWKSPHRENIDTYTIITTQANSFMKRFHHRMPVILVQEDEDRWLEESPKDITLLEKLITEGPSPQLVAYEVSTLVNIPSHDNEECITPRGILYE